MPVSLVSGYAGDAPDGAGSGDDAPEPPGKPIVPGLLLARVRELLDRTAAGSDRVSV